MLVVIPTYNERDNLEPLLTRLHDAVPEADALVVDDGSPDGTGELADKLADDDPRVTVLHRTAKAGLGAAYLAGFATALSGEYRIVVEMDADGSHAPEDLPALLAALDGPPGADVVLGSRYVHGRPGRQLARLPQLDLPQRQPVLAARAGRAGSATSPAATACSAARCWRPSPCERVESQGYCFQIDLAWRALQAGFRVVEVPITFTERERGSSKMSNAIVAEALWKVTQWGVTRHWTTGASPPPGVQERLTDDGAGPPKWTGPLCAGVRRSRRDARRAAPVVR